VACYEGRDREVGGWRSDLNQQKDIMVSLMINEKSKQKKTSQKQINPSPNNVDYMQNLYFTLLKNIAPFILTHYPAEMM